MEAGREDRTLTAGRLFTFELTLCDDEDCATPHDFTDHDGLWIVRYRQSDAADELTRASVDDGRITFPNPLDGEVQIEIPADESESFEVGCYWYWLSFWPDGQPELAEPWLEGELKVVAGGGGL